MPEIRDKKNTRKKILNGAFKLFLQKNYEKVTVADIEKSIQMTRGAIFYHNRNKEELFIDVINTFILKELGLSNFYEPECNCRLKDFIDQYINYIHETMIAQQRLGIGNFHRCYISLIFQALQYYPGFDDLMTQKYQKENEIWYNVVLRAFNNKEIKQDLIVENIVKQFRYLYSGLYYENSFKYGLDITALKQLYYTLYEQIKL